MRPHRLPAFSSLKKTLVVEIIGTGSEAIDTVTKRREHARAGIPQYWTVWPGHRPEGDDLPDRR
jgi:hypothetical protein